MQHGTLQVVSQAHFKAPHTSPSSNELRLAGPHTHDRAADIESTARSGNWTGIGSFTLVQGSRETRVPERVGGMPRHREQRVPPHTPRMGSRGIILDSEGHGIHEKLHGEGCSRALGQAVFKHARLGTGKPLGQPPIAEPSCISSLRSLLAVQRRRVAESALAPLAKALASLASAIAEKRTADVDKYQERVDIIEAASAWDLSFIGKKKPSDLQENYMILQDNLWAWRSTRYRLKLSGSLHGRTSCQPNFFRKQKCSATARGR